MGGTATLPVLVPGAAALLGGTFYNQYVSSDLGVNMVGVITSNGAEGRIGG